MISTILIILIIFCVSIAYFYEIHYSNKRIKLIEKEIERLEKKK